MLSHHKVFQFPQQHNIIGVVGGMGPESGIYLCNQLVANTEADKDQEHIPFILMSLPGKIGDRTEFLSGQIRENPAFEIADLVGKLEVAGASIVGISCNTAHSPAIYDVIVKELESKGSGVRLLNMPMETCHHLRENFPMVSRVGLMTTNGTYKSKVYENILVDMGYEVVLPDWEFQDMVIHRAVYDPAFGIKARPGKCSDELEVLLEQAVGFFVKNRVQAVILGCTEFSSVNMGSRGDLLFIDSTVSLAKALLREAAITDKRLCRV